MNENKEIPVVSPEKDLISSDDVLAVVSGNQDAINRQMEKAKELAAAGIDSDLVGLPIDQQKRIMDERRKKAEEEAEAERRRREQLAQEEALRNSPAEKKRLAREAKQKAREEAKRAKEEARRKKKLAKKGNVAVAEVPKTEPVSTELPSPPAPVTATSTASVSPTATTASNTTNVTPVSNVTTDQPVTPSTTSNSSEVTSAPSTPVNPTPSAAPVNNTPTPVIPHTTPVTTQGVTPASPVATPINSTDTTTSQVSTITPVTPESSNVTPSTGDEADSSKKSSNLKIYLAFIFLALLIWMIVFLPDISSFVQDFFNQKKDSEEPTITDGMLVCTLNTNDDTFDYVYEANFEFEDNKMNKLTLVTTTVGDESLDSISLSGLNSSCQLLENQTANLEGVEVSCDLNGGTFINKQELDYSVLQKEKLTTAYLEAGGVYPDYEYQQDIDEIEKEMNANNYSCSRYEK